MESSSGTMCKARGGGRPSDPVRGGPATRRSDRQVSNSSSSTGGALAAATSASQLETRSALGPESKLAVAKRVSEPEATAALLALQAPRTRLAAARSALIFCPASSPLRCPPSSPQCSHLALPPLSSSPDWWAQAGCRCMRMLCRPSPSRCELSARGGGEEALRAVGPRRCELSARRCGLSARGGGGEEASILLRPSKHASIPLICRDEASRPRTCPSEWWYTSLGASRCAWTVSAWALGRLPSTWPPPPCCVGLET